MKDRYGNQLNRGDKILIFNEGFFEEQNYYHDGFESRANDLVVIDSILPALEKLKKIEEYVGESHWATDLPIKHLKKILRGESESDPNSTENLGQSPDSTEPEPLNEEVEP